ncbi:MAG: trigger factor [Pseudomonadota bacterium]
MQVQVEDISTIKKRLTVEVPGERVTSSIDSAYRELAKTAKVKGFRPNKVPRGILERFYKEQVEAQVASDLVDAVYPEAVVSARLEPVSRPVIEDYVLKAGEDFRFSAVIEVRPEVDVSDYLGLTVEVPRAEVTAEMVDAQAEALREEHGQMEEVDEPLAEGLWANADFEAFCDGTPVRALTGKGEVVRIGPEAEQSDIERAVLGMRRGEEREVKVHMPPNHRLPSLRDKDVNFLVKMLAVQRKVLPPLDDEFAKELNFDDLAQLRERVRADLQTKTDAVVNHKLRENLVNILIERTPFEVPEALVEREVDAMVDSLKQRLSPRRVDIEDVNVERVRENFRPGAGKRVRADFLLAAVAVKEKIEVSEEDIEKGIQDLATEMNETPARIREFHERSNLMDALKGHLREEKTMDFLVKHANIKEVAPESGSTAS